MLKMAEALPRDWEVDYEDIGNVYAREKIQSVTPVCPPQWPFVYGHAIATKKAVGWNLI